MNILTCHHNYNYARHDMVNEVLSPVRETNASFWGMAVEVFTGVALRQFAF